VAPSAVGVSQPRMDGSDLRVDLSVTGRIAVRSGDKAPKIEPTPFPKLSSVTEPPGFHVNAEWRVPRKTLSAELDRDLRGMDLGKGKGKGDPKLSIASAEIRAHADDKHPHRMQIKLGLDGALHDEVEAYADVEYDAGAQRLTIERFEFTPESEQLLEKKLKGIDLGAVRKQIARKARWNLAANSGEFDRAIAGALNSNLRDQVRVSGELTQFELKRFTVEDDALTGDIILGGLLEVAYLPR
jgi:hypothetical protein